MKNSEYLTKARDAILNESNWIKKSFATDKEGRQLFSGAFDGACKFCTIGALEYAVGREYTGRKLQELSNLLSVKVGGPKERIDPVIEFNDAPETTHADVLALFNAVIEEELEKENSVD